MTTSPDTTEEPHWVSRSAYHVVSILFLVGEIALAAVLCVAYFAIMTAANGFGMNGRFRIPVNTFIFTFAIYGFFAFRKNSIKKHEETFNHNPNL